MASILHLRLILQRFDDLMLLDDSAFGEMEMPQFVLFFFYPLEKRPWRAFFRFEFRRLILICSRQDVHFDKGLPFLSYVFAAFSIYPFLLLFSFCLFLLCCWLLY